MGFCGKMADGSWEPAAIYWCDMLPRGEWTTFLQVRW
jgi:hypothetical protein